jgi:hypothetical protein
MSGSSGFHLACPTKPRGGRPTGPTTETVAFRQSLLPILAELNPCTVRQVFYQAVWRGLAEKSENGYDKVQRNLLAMRRDGSLPYDWICDLYRELRGYNYYSGPDEFIQDVAALYRRDLWRHAEIRVEFWCEKATLIGFLDPILSDKWGLDYWAGGGFTSETALFKAGSTIAAQKKPTQVFVLSDFDPSGEDIAENIINGSKKCPGGLSRFTQGVPVTVEKLAVTRGQIREWNLPTRPVNTPGKTLTTRKRRFIDDYGDAAVELDAIPPNLFRNLIDKTIARFFDERQLEALRAVETSERELFSTWLTRGREATP